MKTYTSVIIDIVDSQSYEVVKRNELQGLLLQLMDKLNRIFKQSLAFEVTFSAGDEMQGLFNDTLAAVMYVRLLEMLVHPVAIRAGIGVGEWNVVVREGRSTDQDGPAYHNARNAIETVYRMQSQRIRLQSGREQDIIANFLLNISMGFIREQSFVQNQVQLVSEILYPFVENGLDKKGKENLRELLLVKEGNVNKEKLYVREEIDLADEIVEDQRAVTKKNSAQHIAEVLGKTRQNIDAALKRGKVIDIRNADYMALQYIKKNYGGKNAF